MAKIQTKVPVLYDSRDHKFGKVIIEMNVTQNGAGHTIEVSDSSNVEGVITHLRRKTFYKTAEEINGLYDMVASMVDPELSYTEREASMKSYALLAFVQNDPIKDAEGKNIKGKTIYNLKPDDWEIITDETPI